jgi:hypothetical protein
MTEPHESTRSTLLAASGPDRHAHDDHRDGPPLGPVDAQAWGAGILGVAVGGVVAVLLYLVSYH